MNALRNKNIGDESRHGDISSENSLKQLQQKDKDVATVKQLIKGNNRPDANAMSAESSTVKALMSQRQKINHIK